MACRASNEGGGEPRQLAWDLGGRLRRLYSIISRRVSLLLWAVISQSEAAAWSSQRSGRGVIGCLLGVKCGCKSVNYKTEIRAHDSSLGELQVDLWGVP